MIETPFWFKEGLKFNSKWINNGQNTCEILWFDDVRNLAGVKITTPESEWIEDGWNLQHTIWGFNNMDYRKIKK